jgi:Na+-transporting methylmalonyl-CoA/oxaloacetate decarboxylase gamma subunit
MADIPLMDGLRVMGLGLGGVFAALGLVYLGVVGLTRAVSSFGTDKAATTPESNKE